jgi:hypothetical protein
MKLFLASSAEQPKEALTVMHAPEAQAAPAPHS